MPSCSTFTSKSILFFLTIFTFSLTAGAQANPPLTSSKCNEFTFDATGSYDPDDKNLDFEWNFGDGNSSRDPIINYIYDRSGDYEVGLSVTDNSGLQCSTAVTKQMVRVNIPPYASFIGPDMICVDQAAIFDASGSYDDSGENLGYKWQFGDGSYTSGSKTATKTYTKGGTYNVALEVDDQSGTVCNTENFQKTIHVNAPPVANAGQENILKCVNGDGDLLVHFDASNTSDANNDPLTYIWDFGDGQKQTGIKVSHQFSDIGNYDVKLVVKDNTTLGCGTSVDFVTVKLNKAPKADAGDDIVSCAGEVVEFNGANSFVNKKGTIDAKWFFGDGRSSLGLKATHSYSKPGQYQASLEVENKLNAMCPPSRDTRTVTINSMPSVIIKTVNAVCLGTEVQFDASAASDPDGDELEYYWSFGDGAILKSGPKVSHTYQQGGHYRVTVVVDDSKGSSCSTATASANIRVNTPPVANAGPNTACCVAKSTKFDASSSSDPDGDTLTYTWNFGDGAETNKGR